MTQEQIMMVEQLRHDGIALTVIAKETGVSINTIKSHLARHGIKAPQRVRTCLFCNSEIKAFKHFCSDACRTGWYEGHREEEQEILRMCKTCGALFEPRCATQVYCSKTCFYYDRYHSKPDVSEDEEMLMSIPREAAIVLVKAIADYFLSCGWVPPENRLSFEPSDIVDLFIIK